MRVIRDRVPEDETERELLLVGDTVKLVTSPLDRLKRGAKGIVKAIHGDLATDKNCLVSVLFTCGGLELPLCASADHFRFTKHPKGEPIPDAENVPTAPENEEA